MKFLFGMPRFPVALHTAIWLNGRIEVDNQTEGGTMAKSQRARQKKQAAKKAKRKLRLKKASAGQGQSGVLSAIKRCARGAVHECYVSDHIFDGGIGTVVFSRHSAGEPGQIGFAVMLVDAHCLGVKDCFFHVGSEDAFRDELARLARSQLMHSAKPEKAVKIIQGAIAFARDAGFTPHRDYAHLPLLFHDVDPSLCEETFEYGRDGKPCYVQGPFDSPTRVSRIFKTLQAKLGDGGFHYIMGGEDLSDGDLEEDDWEEDEENDLDPE